MKDELKLLETRQDDLRLRLAADEGSARAPFLHPNLAEVYRRKVAELATLIEGGMAAEAFEAIRGLVDTITLTPDGEGLRVELRGELAAMLALASDSKKPGGEARLLEQIKVVAGTGFEPVTFRL